MNPIILLLEESDLITAERVRKFITGCSDTQIFAFNEKLKEAIRHSEQDLKPATNDPLGFYNFMASYSLRGDNCRHVGCRVEKARLVERYSALYCDQVILPLWYEDHDPVEEPDREVLAGALLSLVQLRRVIEKGYVKIVESDLPLCEECCEKEVPYYHQVLEACRISSSDFIKQFKFTATDLGSAGIKMLIEGPPAFIEHGGKQRIFPRVSEWASLLKGRKKAVLPYDLVREQNLMRHIFLQPAMDVALHRQHYERSRTNYLTNLEGEAFLASGILHNSKHSTISKSADLAHRIPLLQNLDVNDIMRLREDEHNSFLLYRKALERTVQERFGRSTKLTQSEVDEIYEDVLLPEVLKLRTALRTKHHSSRVKSFLKSAGAASVVIAIGAFTGPISQRVLEWAATTAAVNLGRELVESALEPLQIPDEVRSNPMYFLLKASEKLED